jgi:hypothetical protein
MPSEKLSVSLDVRSWRACQALAWHRAGDLIGDSYVIQRMAQHYLSTANEGEREAILDEYLRLDRERLENHLWPGLIEGDEHVEF